MKRRISLTLMAIMLIGMSVAVIAQNKADKRGYYLETGRVRFLDQYHWGVRES